MSAKKSKQESKPAEIELDPDAWPRFEQFVKDVAKAGPRHRPAPKQKARPRQKNR